MTDNPPSWRGHGHVTHVYIWGRMKLDISNLVSRLNVNSTAITHVKVLQYESGSGDL